MDDDNPRATKRLKRLKTLSKHAIELVTASDDEENNPVVHVNNDPTPSRKRRVIEISDSESGSDTELDEIHIAPKLEPRKDPNPNQTLVPVLVHQLPTVLIGASELRSAPRLDAFQKMFKVFRECAQPDGVITARASPKITNVAGLTWSAKINWTLGNAMREFFQNMIDHVRSTYGESFRTKLNPGPNVTEENKSEWALGVYTSSNESTDDQHELVAAAVSSQPFYDANGLLKYQLVRFSQLNGEIEPVRFLKNSNKKAGMLGGFGEGFKVAIHVLLKSFDAHVYLANGNEINKFSYGDEEIPGDPGSRVLLRTCYTKSRPKNNNNHLPGIEFAVFLPYTGAELFSLREFQQTTLAAQPSCEFVAISSKLQARLHDVEKPGSVYVGTLKIEDLVSSEFPGLMFNVSDPTDVTLGRDRASLTIKRDGQKVSLEQYVVSQLCETVASLKSVSSVEGRELGIFNNSVVQKVWASVRHRENLVRLVLSRYWPGDSTTPAAAVVPDVLLVPEDLVSEARDLVNDVLAESRAKQALTVLVSATNKVVSPDCNDLPGVVIYLAQKTSRILDFLPVHPAADILITLAKQKHPLGGQGVRQPVFVDMPPLLTQVVSDGVADGVWQHNALWVPVSCLDNPDSVRNFAYLICKKMGFWRSGLSLPDPLTASSIVSLFENLHDAVKKEKNESDSKMDEFLTKYRQSRADRPKPAVVVVELEAAPAPPPPQPPAGRAVPVGPTQLPPPLQRAPPLLPPSTKPARRLPGARDGPSDGPGQADDANHILSLTQRALERVLHAHRQITVSSDVLSFKKDFGQYDFAADPGSDRDGCCPCDLRGTTLIKTPQGTELLVDPAVWDQNMDPARVDLLVDDARCKWALEQILKERGYYVTVDHCTFVTRCFSKPRVVYFWKEIDVYGFTPTDNSGLFFMNLYVILNVPKPLACVQFVQTLFHEFAHVILNQYEHWVHDDVFRRLQTQINVDFENKQ